MSMFIIDAHLDLAMNALEWNRDLKTSVFEIRKPRTGNDRSVGQGKRLQSLCRS